VLDALAIALLVLTAVLYARGWVLLRRRLPGRFGARQLLAFAVGLDVLLVAMAPPVEVLARQSLAVHMTQHLLLMMVAPPLIWLGAPAVPVLLGLPARIRKVVVDALARPPARRTRRALTHPAVGWASFAIMTWAWHVPVLYELALGSSGWHHLEHAGFLGGGLLFWWPVVQPWPSTSRWPRWAMIPYLVLAEVQNTLLAAIFTFSGRVLYPSYAIGAGGEVLALQDQIVAGLLMWGPGSLIFLIPAARMIVQLLAPAGMAAPAPPRRTRAVRRPGAMMG
jgi:cytochrome c oxidase assembly factor CtaG